MTKDETIEPSLAETMFTPSEHGSSAALRAQVIEECAKVIAGITVEVHESSSAAAMAAYVDGIADAKQAAINVIRSLSAVPAIAQERDVEQLIIDAYKRGFEWCIENLSNWQARQFVDKAARDYADFVISTTSPKAIGEEPSSSEAVNTTPLSIEVGEMVERLLHPAYSTSSIPRYYDYADVSTAREAASLLMRIARELETTQRDCDMYQRLAYPDPGAQGGDPGSKPWKKIAEELREALKPFARDADEWPRNADSDTLALTDPEGLASPYNITVGDLRRARSALPASDEPR